MKIFDSIIAWAIVTLVVVTILTLFAGCAALGLGPPADEIRIKRGEAGLMYGDLKQIYGMAFIRVTDACRHQKLSPEACQEAKDINQRIVAMDRQARLLLVSASPPASVDAETLGQLVQLISRLGLLGLGVP